MQKNCYWWVEKQCQYWAQIKINNNLLYKTYYEIIVKIL